MSFIIVVFYRFLEIFQLFLIIRAVISWIVPVDERLNNKIINFFYEVTDPVVNKAKKEITDKIEFFRRTPVDLTVLVVFFGIQIIKRFLLIFF